MNWIKVQEHHEGRVYTCKLASGTYEVGRVVMRNEEFFCEISQSGYARITHVLIPGKQKVIIVDEPPTLLDTFACAILQEMAPRIMTAYEPNWEGICKRAYDGAEAMMAERKKRIV